MKKIRTTFIFKILSPLKIMTKKKTKKIRAAKFSNQKIDSIFDIFDYFHLLLSDYYVLTLKKQQQKSKIKFVFNFDSNYFKIIIIIIINDIMTY